MGVQKGAAFVVKILTLTFVRSFCCISLDSGERYWIRRDDLPVASFREGDEIEEEDFLQRIRICQYPRALNHAVSLLARRPHSKKEIRSALLRLRYTEDVTGLVVYRLEKENLLNDQEFCEQWIRFRLSRFIGRSAVRRELLMKGIPARDIDRAFEQIDPEEERIGADLLARKAWKRAGSGEDLRKTRQKIIASLVRKGYDWETARAACEKAEKERE